MAAQRGKETLGRIAQGLLLRSGGRSPLSLLCSRYFEPTLIELDVDGAKLVLPGKETLK